jgi:hypothetical protein
MDTMNGRTRRDRQFHIIGEEEDLKRRRTASSNRHDQLLKLAITFATEDLCVFPMHWVNKGYCSCGSTICKAPGIHPIEWAGACHGTTSIPTIMQWWSCYSEAHVGLGLSGDGKGGMVVPNLDADNLQKAVQAFVDTPSVYWRSITRTAEIYSFRHPCTYISLHRMDGECGQAIRLKSAMAIYDYSIAQASEDDSHAN